VLVPLRLVLVLVLVTVVTVEQVHQLIHLGEVQQQQDKTFLELIIMQAVVAVVLGYLRLVLVALVVVAMAQLVLLLQD
jgi:hypothetical protein